MKQGWSSTYEMMKQYFEIKHFLDTNDTDIATILPSAVDDIQLSTLLGVLKGFESVSKKLHEVSCTKRDVRKLFDALLVEHRDFFHYLGENGIIHSPDFETALIKYQKKEEISSVENDILTTAFSKSSQPASESKTQVSMSFAERVLAKTPKIDANEFESLDWVPCTSNVAERLFSQVRHVFTDYRKSMLSHHLESQIFLAVNRDFWNAQIVAKLM